MQGKLLAPVTTPVTGDRVRVSHLDVGHDAGQAGQAGAAGPGSGHDSGHNAATTAAAADVPDMVQGKLAPVTGDRVRVPLNRRLVLIGHKTGVTFTGRSGSGVGVGLLESGGQGRSDLAISPKRDGGANPLPNVLCVQNFDANKDDDFFGLGVVETTIEEELLDLDETESLNLTINNEIVKM